MPRTKVRRRVLVDDLTHYMEATARLKAERDVLRAALERIEPLIDAQFEGHADVPEFMEKVRKLNEALDVVRAALARHP
jgi:predicted  nucleic acid-binding Zn-ribbon protein